MKLKGSYTVEAAIVFSFICIVFGTAMGVAFNFFTEGSEYIKSCKNDMDVVQEFRVKEEMLRIKEKLEDGD